MKSLKYAPRLLLATLFTLSGCVSSPPQTDLHVDDLFAESGLTVRHGQMFATGSLKGDRHVEDVTRILIVYLQRKPDAWKARDEEWGAGRTRLRCRDFCALALARIKNKDLILFVKDSEHEREIKIQNLLDSI